jgi:ferredoxin
MKSNEKRNPSGPINIHGWKVWVDRKLCIGVATCIAVAENTYKLDKEGKAVFLDTAEKDSKETILDSAKACPVAAIIIEDENGKRIYPKK